MCLRRVQMRPGLSSPRNIPPRPAVSHTAVCGHTCTYVHRGREMCWAGCHSWVEIWEWGNSFCATKPRLTCLFLLIPTFSLFLLGTSRNINPCVSLASRACPVCPQGQNKNGEACVHGQQCLLPPVYGVALRSSFDLQLRWSWSSIGELVKCAHSTRLHSACNCPT